MNDRTLGIAALALAAFMTWAGWDIEAPFAYEPVGRVPSAAAGADHRPVRPAAGHQGGNPVQANAPGANGRIALMVLFCAGYAFLFQWLGFIVATALMTVAVGRLFGGGWGVRHRRRGHELLFVLFDKVLDVVLPGGLLENLI